ncbi:MAG: hypothetical protein ACTSYC_10155 [Promethearchaeota archaeon]
MKGLKLKGWWYAKSYRRVYFSKKKLRKNNPSLRAKILSHWFSSMPWFQAKYPQEILLELKMKKRRRDYHNIKTQSS